MVTQTAICNWFGISRQAHQQMKLRGLVRTAEEALILQEVRRIRASHPRMGTRKLLLLMADSLQIHGIDIGRDRLFDLLRRQNQLIQRKRKATRTTFPGGLRSENVLAASTITTSNQAFVADLTYIETESGFLYLALVTDLYSRKIVGWDLSNSLSLEGALRALQMAVHHAGGKVPGLIHHSDHGSQYTSRPYLAFMKEAGIRPSMGEVGNAYDNAVAERVNGILKLEYLLDHRFPDQHAAMRATRQAIHFYNTERPHSSLGWRMPVQVYRQGLDQEAKDGLGCHDGVVCEKAGSVKGRCRTDLRQPLTGPVFSQTIAPGSQEHRLLIS